MAQGHLSGTGGRDTPDSWGGPPLAAVLRRPPAAPRPLAHGARRRQQLPAGPFTRPPATPGATGRAVGGAGGANGDSPQVPALLAFPPPRLDHSQVEASARAMATVRPASSGRHCLPRDLIARYRGEAGIVPGAVTARRLLCVTAAAAGPGEPLGAGGRGSGAGGGGWAVSERGCPEEASPGHRGQRRGAALVGGGRGGRAGGGPRASSPRAAPGTRRSASGERRPRRAPRQREGGAGSRPAASTTRPRPPFPTAGKGTGGQRSALASLQLIGWSSAGTEEPPAPIG